MGVTLSMVTFAALCIAPTESLSFSRASVVRSAVAVGGVLIPTKKRALAEVNSLQQPSQVVYSPPAVRSQSTPATIALARHLQKSGATLYGAYWCSHCYNQKVAFGAGAAHSLNYVECAADGYNSQRKLCGQKLIKGYPTWEIGGVLYAGEQSLGDLANLSNFPGKSVFKTDAD